MKRLIATACALTFATAATTAHAQSFLRQIGERAAQAVVDAAIAKTGATGGVNPYSQGRPPSMATGGSSSAAASSWQRYGNWDFRLEEAKVGVDEQWQAVLGVRNAAGHRQGVVASEIKVFLITEDGETLANWGELYRASVEGSSAGLETALGTLWLEPGDETRVRLRFDNSRNIKPVKIRIQSTGATAQTRTFDLG